jgi:hypothetical protein
MEHPRGCKRLVSTRPAFWIGDAPGSCRSNADKAGDDFNRHKAVTPESQTFDRARRSSSLWLSVMLRRILSEAPLDLQSKLQRYSAPELSGLDQT